MAKLVTSNPEYNRRAAIIESLRAGRTPSEIIMFFGYPRSTVYDIAQRYMASEKSEEGSSTPARKIQIRGKAIRTPKLIQRAQDLILENPGISLRKLATILGVSDSTVCRIAQEDLRYTSYVLKVRQMLSEAAKTKRLAYCNMLVCSLKNEAADRLRFFSDEKIFIVDAKVNQRNDCWLAHDPEDVPIIAKTLSVHVLSVISSEGDVMPPHFFQKGETVTKEIYLEILRTVVKPWMEAVASGRPYIFQQDSTSVYTSHLVQNWLSDNVDMFWTKEFWPPNSLDLNPLDYYVWSVIERVINKSRHSNVASLRAAIEAVFAAMDRARLKTACSRFKTRIEAVIEAQGSYIEQKLVKEMNMPTENTSCNANININKIRCQKKEQKCEIKIEEIKTEEIDIEEVNMAEMEIEEIKTEDIEIGEIKTEDIEIGEIKTEDIEIGEIKTEDIEIGEIKTEDIEIREIKTEDIEIGEIKTEGIDIDNMNNINF